ncbi:MAG: hypothetical protein WC068_16620 [Caulobacter sp.]
MRNQIANYQGAHLVASQETPNQILWAVRITDHPEEAIIMKMADAVHNLRSALDHAAVSTVILNEKSPKGVYFPIAESADFLDEMIRRKNFYRASNEAVALLKRIAPFRGGNALVRGLHDLDVLDKHNDLIPTFQAANMPGTLFIGTNQIANMTSNLSDGSKWISAPGTGAAIMRPIPLRLVVQFEESQPFGRNEIVPVLARLAQEVGGIVEAFAALYRR